MNVVFMPAGWRVPNGRPERSGRPGRPGQHIEPVVLLGAVLLLHATLVAGWQHRPAAEPLARRLPQVLELLRAPEPPKPEPPPPPPPPKPVPRAATPQPAVAPPPPALRTPAAEPEVPANAITVPENTQAPRSTGPVVAAAPAPAPPPPAPEEPLVEASAYAGYLRNPPPLYPATALRQGWQGRVVLRVHVRADGRPDAVELRTSSGRKVLDDAALEAVRGWTFAPARRGNTPVAAWATVPVEFKLSE